MRTRSDVACALLLVSSQLACLRPPPPRADSSLSANAPPAQPRPDAPTTTTLPPPPKSPRATHEVSPLPPLTLVMAKATTTATGSQPATCLLDPACPGTWEPAAVDDGVDESVLFMFDAPVDCKAIEVELAQPVTSSREQFPPVIIPNERGGATVDATTSDGWTWRGACSHGD